MGRSGIIVRVLDFLVGFVGRGRQGLGLNLIMFVANSHRNGSVAPAVNVGIALHLAGLWVAAAHDCGDGGHGPRVSKIPFGRFPGVGVVLDRVQLDEIGDFEGVKL